MNQHKLNSLKQINTHFWSLEEAKSQGFLSVQPSGISKNMSKLMSYDEVIVSKINKNGLHNSVNVEVNNEQEEEGAYDISKLQITHDTSPKAELANRISGFMYLKRLCGAFTDCGLNFNTNTRLPGMTLGEIEFIEDLNKLHHCEESTDVSKNTALEPFLMNPELGEREGAIASTSIDNTISILKKPNLSKWKPRKMSYHCERQEVPAEEKVKKRHGGVKRKRTKRNVQKYKDSKLETKTKITKFTSESSDLSLISSDSPSYEGSCLSRYHASDKPKGGDFSDEEFENFFKNYKMEISNPNHMKAHKRSLSESGQFRNYVIKETRSSAEQSPVKKPARKAKIFSKMNFASGVRAVNKSHVVQQEDDFKLANIVKNLADLEKNMDKPVKRSKRRVKKSRPKSKKSTFSTTKSKF